MFDLLIALAFIGMVLCPALAASFQQRNAVDED